MRGIKVVQVASLLAAAMFLVTSAACASTGASPAQHADLVKAKCTLCHTLERVDQANYDQAGWEDTIARMRKNGAVMTDAEATEIATYLSQSGEGK